MNGRLSAILEPHSDAQREYVCPGETHPISRAVHLARMAAYYPKCRDCRHRHDGGHLPVKELPVLSTHEGPSQRGLRVGEGIRGVYLNELDRAAAARLAAAFASLLWEQKGGATPVIVTGCDQRPSSPDLVAGVLDSLKRMGCDVIDVGPTITPHFRMAVRTHGADGGVFVNGAGCDPSWNGLDFVGRDALPPSTDSPFNLHAVCRLAEQPINRPTRNAGTLRSDRDWRTYERSLRKHFHALRPLDVAVGTATALQQRVVSDVFAELPCRLTLVPLPTRKRDLADPLDADVRRVGNAVVDRRGHLGFVIDENAIAGAAIDETGALVSAANLARLLSQWSQSEGHRVDFTGDAVVTLGCLLAALSCSDADLSEIAKRA